MQSTALHLVFGEFCLFRISIPRGRVATTLQYPAHAAVARIRGRARDSDGTSWMQEQESKYMQRSSWFEFFLWRKIGSILVLHWSIEQHGTQSPLSSNFRLNSPRLPGSRRTFCPNTSLPSPQLTNLLHSLTALSSNVTTSHATKPSAVTNSVFEAAVGAAVVRRRVNAKNQRKDKILDIIRRCRRRRRTMAIRGRELDGMRRRRDKRKCCSGYGGEALERRVFPDSEGALEAGHVRCGWVFSPHRQFSPPCCDATAKIRIVAVMTKERA